ncbi:MAG TPA: phosphotransferase, partial [Actinomycetota bacterium]|nr:phosphotransferase [Actinomycetota bacterium]
HRWRTIFGKVLPEKKATQSVETLNRVGGPRRPHLVVPFAMEDGVSFSNPAPGRSLRDLLLAGDALPAPARVAGLVNDIGNIPGIPSAGDHRMRPERIARATAELLGRLVPESLSRIALIEEAVGRGARSDQVPARVVHGDLYEAQVFVGADYSLGLIDLDDLGPGDPAMDAANFCAHLLALALAVPSASSRLVAYRHLVRREFMATLGIGPAELRWREALAVLLLATGPFRVLDPRWPEQVRRRIELAVRLMEEPRWSTSS